MGALEIPKKEVVPAALGSDASIGGVTLPSGGPPTRGRVLVAYGSRFGNTQRIAESLAAGMRKASGVAVDCLFIDDVSIESLARYDLLAIGGPTEKMSASQPMKEFLAKLPTIALRGRQGFAFDTRYDLPMSGSAGKVIEKSLERLGVEIARPHASAFVRGMNKEEKALYGGQYAPDWIRKLGKTNPRDAAAKPTRLDLLYPESEANFEKIGTELDAIFTTPPPLLSGASSA
jgi:flavodoxin